MSARPLGFAAIGGLAAAVVGFVTVAGWAPSSTAIISGILALAGLGLMHTATGMLHLKNPTHLGFFYLLYLVTVFLPGFGVARDHPGAAANAYLVAVHVTLITLPLGALISNAVTGFRRSEVAEWFKMPVESARPSLHVTVLYALALVVGVFLALEYVREAPVIPLVEVLRNPRSGAELILLREESFKLLDSPLRYAFDLQRRVAFPFVICLGLGWWLVTRRRAWLVALVVSGVVGLVYSSLSFAKGPPAAIVLVASIFLFLYAGGRITARALGTSIVLVLAFPLAVMSALDVAGEFTLGPLLGLLAHRMFYLPAEILYYYFEIFPTHMAHTNGLTIARLAALVGSPEVDVANVVFRYMYPTGLLTGPAPAAFIGALHADFGLAGVATGGVLLGGAVQSIQVMLLRRPKTIPCLAASAFIYWGTWQFNLTAMPQTFLSGGILLVLAAMLVLEWGGRGLAMATEPSVGRPG